MNKRSIPCGMLLFAVLHQNKTCRAGACSCRLRCRRWSARGFVGTGVLCPTALAWSTARGYSLNALQTGCRGRQPLQGVVCVCSGAEDVAPYNRATRSINRRSLFLLQRFLICVIMWVIHFPKNAVYIDEGPKRHHEREVHEWDRQNAVAC